MRHSIPSKHLRWRGEVGLWMRWNHLRERVLGTFSWFASGACRILSLGSIIDDRIAKAYSAVSIYSTVCSDAS